MGPDSRGQHVGRYKIHRNLDTVLHLSKQTGTFEQQRSCLQVMGKWSTTVPYPGCASIHPLVVIINNALHTVGTLALQKGHSRFQAQTKEGATANRRACQPATRCQPGCAANPANLLRMPKHSAMLRCQDSANRPCGL